MSWPDYSDIDQHIKPPLLYEILWYIISWLIIICLFTGLVILKPYRVLTRKKTTVSPVRNCLVIGSGRSGTSMLTGSLSRAGYYMGDDLIPANNSNPKGFFESVEINAINETLISPMIPARPGGMIGRWFFRERPVDGQRWLATVPLGSAVHCPPDLGQRIQKAVGKEPYCFKDPRFCYTLPAWRPYLRNTRFVCVFREPAKTAASIVKEVGDREYLKTFRMAYQEAISLWTLMHRHVLETHRHEGEWLFVHYNQLFEQGGRQRLGTFLDAVVDESFAERRFSRSSSDGDVPEDATIVYRQLCELAAYSD